MSVTATVFDALGRIAGGAVAPITDLLKARELRKTRQAELASADHQAELTARMAGKQLDSSWEIESIRNSGWKDEFWSLILAPPLVFAFIPGCTGYVDAGFAVLARAPNEYWWALFTAIASAFGVRPLLRWIRGKRK